MLIGFAPTLMHARAAFIVAVMARDEFPKPVIDALRLRVGARCSNPDCRRPTTGPAAGPVAVSSVGVAAHIHAAASGGPRYLAGMSREQRRAIGNGVWLCGICATKVDRDVAKFSPDLLRAWKEMAEKQAANEQGNRLPSTSDALNQLVVALTGSPRGLLPQAISNTHAAVVASMEAIDPRFRVRSRFDNGKVRFELTAREPMHLRITAHTDAAAAWAEGMHRMLTNAEPVALPMTGAAVHGSPLLAAIHDDGGSAGRLRIEPPSQKVTAKLTVPADDGQLFTDEFPGAIYWAPSLLRFEGHGYGGLLRLDMRLTRLDNDLTQATLSIQPKFDAWNGKDVRRLPFQERLEALFHGVARQSDQVRIAFEVDGKTAFSASGVDVIRPEDAKWFLNHLAYVRRAQRIAHYTGVAIQVRGDYSAADHDALAEAVETFEGLYVRNAAALKADPEMTFVLAGEQIPAFESEQNAVGEFEFVEKATTIRVFGMNVQLPAREARVSNTRPLILSRKDLKSGRKFRVAWQRCEGFRWEYVYVDDTRNPIRPPVMGSRSPAP